MTVVTRANTRRRFDRTRVLLKGTLTSANENLDVLVRDISRGGARVSLASADCGHGDLIFRRGRLFAAARIVWSDGKNAGLSFYRGLDELRMRLAFRQG
jgi:hypothetical protein